LNFQVFTKSIQKPDAECHINDIPWSHFFVKNVDAGALRSLAHHLLTRFPSVVVLTNQCDQKVGAIIAVHPDYLERVKAQEWIKEVVSYLGGKGGGGKPDFAQGGGEDVSKIPDLLLYLASLKREQV